MGGGKEGREGLGKCSLSRPVHCDLSSGILGGSVGESTCSAGDMGDPGLIPGSGRSPGGGHGNPLQCSCLRKFHGQRSLVGHSP